MQRSPRHGASSITHAQEVRATSDSESELQRTSKGKPTGLLSNEEYKAELARQVEEQRRRKQEEEQRVREREELDEKRLARQQRELLAQVHNDMTAAKQEPQQAPAARKGALPRTPPVAYSATNITTHLEDGHASFEHNHLRAGADPSSSDQSAPTQRYKNHVPHAHSGFHATEAEMSSDQSALLQRYKNQAPPRVCVVNADDDGTTRRSQTFAAQQRNVDGILDVPATHYMEQLLQRDLAKYASMTQTPAGVVGESKENSSPQKGAWDKVIDSSSQVVIVCLHCLHTCVCVYA